MLGAIPGSDHILCLRLYSFWHSLHQWSAIRRPPKGDCSNAPPRAKYSLLCLRRSITPSVLIVAGHRKRNCFRFPPMTSEFRLSQASSKHNVCPFISTTGVSRCLQIRRLDAYNENGLVSRPLLHRTWQAKNDPQSPSLPPMPKTTALLSLPTLAVDEKKPTVNEEASDKKDRIIRSTGTSSICLSTRKRHTRWPDGRAAHARGIEGRDPKGRARRCTWNDQSLEIRRLRARCIHLRADVHNTSLPASGHHLRARHPGRTRHMDRSKAEGSRKRA